MEKEIFDAIIVGAGVAGCTAAIQCNRLGLNICLLDENGRAGGLIENANLIENYPGLDSDISGVTFVKNLLKQLKKQAITVKQERVRSLAFDEKDCAWTLFGANEIYETTNVILATGTVSNNIIFENQSLVNNHLFYDFTKLIKNRPDIKNVTIVGSGEAALDHSLYFAKNEIKTTILCRGDKIRAQGVLSKRVQDSECIEVLTNTRVESLLGCDGNTKLKIKLTGDSEKEIITDSMLIAVGRKRVLPHIFINKVRYQHNSDLTAPQGLFICGDARLGSLGQAGIAVGDGLQAAMKIAEKINRRDS